MASLSIDLFGTFRVALDDALVTGFESSKVKALLAYLCVEADRPHSRDALIGLLWPDYAEAPARRNLSQALFNLRHTLGEDARVEPFLLVTRDAIQFNPQSDARLDVTELAWHLREVARHAHPRLEVCEPCIQHLEDAVALYHGEFLAGFFVAECILFDEWAALLRERYHTEVLDALYHLTRVYEQRHDDARARHYARRQIELEPWREEAHRQLMRLAAYAGQRSAALSQYETCCAVLQAELGLPPQPETTALYEQIRDGAGEFAAPREAPPAPLPPCPYRGLLAFSEADAPFFHGRESAIDDALAAVRTQPLTLVIGPSGSGKSSLVYAGLVPRLRPTWRVLACRPGTQPFAALVAAVAPAATPEAVEGAAEALARGELALAQWLAPTERPTLLVIDQFEELFTLCPDADLRQRYLDIVTDLVRRSNTGDALDVALLLVLRADFMEHVLAYRPFVDVLQRASLILGPMTRDELRRAIVAPARQQGVHFEAGLCERILDDVGLEPGTLPLLAFTLSALWERQDAGWMLTHAAYEDLGRVSGALARYADGVYESLGDEGRGGARRALVQMVQPGDGCEDTSRLATVAELGAEVWPLVQRLADMRLVVTGVDPAGGETAELAHEALIWSWERLRGWLEEDRAFRVWEERLRSALRQWRSSGEDSGALLRGAVLVEAEAWVGNPSVALGEAERGFIRASIALRDREAAAVAAAHQRELAQALALARAERQRAEEQARGRRRFQTLSWGLAFVFLLTVVMAWLAIRESREARRQADVSRSQQLAALSLQHLPASPELGLLMAIEAGYAADTADVYVALEKYFDRRGCVVGLLAGHTGAVVDMAWHPAGDALATASRDGTVRLWSGDGGGPSGVLVDAGGQVEDVAWSGTGEMLLTVGVSGARVWNAEGTLLAVGPEPHPARAAVWNPDGATVAAVDDGGAVAVWEARTGRLLGAWASTDARYLCVDWDVSGARLAAGGADGVVRVWDKAFLDAGGAPEAAPVWSQLAGGAAVDCVRWSPVGARLAFSAADGTVRVAQVTAGADDLLVLDAVGTGPVAIDWSPDGRWLATVGADGVVRIWDAQTGARLLVIGEKMAAAHAAVWSPSGTAIATLHGDRLVRVWEAPKGTLTATLAGHTGRIEAAAWRPDGAQLATSGFDGTIRIWNLAEGPSLVPLFGHASDIFDAASDRDGNTFATAGADASVRIWDAGTGVERAILLGHAERVLAASWAPDGRLVTASKDGTVRVWDMVSGVQAVTVRPGAPVLHAAWNPADARFATSGDNLPLQIWDGDSGKLLLTVRDALRVAALAWAPDGQRLAGMDARCYVRVWNAQTGAVEAQMAEPACTVQAIRWRPNGAQLATAEAENGARVWDMATGALLATLKPAVSSTAPTAVVDAVWSADGSTLIVVDEAGSLHLWSVRDPIAGGAVAAGAPAASVAGEVHGVVAVSAASDGGQLVVAGGAGLVQVWDLTALPALRAQPALPVRFAGQVAMETSGDPQIITGSDDRTVRRFYTSLAELLAFACNHAVRNMTPLEWQDTMGDIPYRETCPSITADRLP